MTPLAVLVATGEIDQALAAIDGRSAAWVADQIDFDLTEDHPEQVHEFVSAWYDSTSDPLVRAEIVEHFGGYYLMGLEVLDEAVPFAVRITVESLEALRVRQIALAASLTDTLHGAPGSTLPDVLRDDVSRYAAELARFGFAAP